MDTKMVVSSNGEKRHYLAFIGNKKKYYCEIQTVQNELDHLNHFNIHTNTQQVWE